MLLTGGHVLGNMELLARYGTVEQKRRWLLPLLDGEIRSCFGMTEPDVASSDALNLQTSVERRDGQYVINGRKWWTSGAMDPRCKVMLLVGKGPARANAERNRHREHSIVLIPMAAKGLRVVRHLTVFGYDDAPHGHAEVELHDVRVDAADALLHREGGGFEAAQSRLGGGRLHHCMRTVGACARANELAVARVAERRSSGKKLLDNDAVLQTIGQNRCDTESMRALTVTAAAAVDAGDERKARVAVGAAKVVVAQMGCAVVERAIQLHGGMGVSEDCVLARMYAHVRSLRIADGPDEVHVKNVAKEEVRAWRQRTAKL